MRGAALTVAARWTDRLIGITSTLILARLLAPADFGIIAMASLVVLLVDTLLDLGVNTALVQNRNTDRHDYDTAWTLRLGQSLLAATIVAAAASFAAGYFNDNRVETVLWFMALSVAVAGFENIGIIDFQKHMAFGREFKFFFLRRLIGFIVTLLLALWLRNYWAMVFGTLAGRLAGVGLSYGMHAFRPRLSLVRVRLLWSFSQWMLARNLGSYGAQQIDKMVLGRRSGASMLGTYQLADDIAAMPVTELLAPIGRVLLPAFVNVANDPPALRRSFSLAFGIQMVIGLPAGVGLALVADTAVPLLLGKQWLSAIPLLRILALISVVTAFTHSIGYLLLALGKVRLQAIFVWCQFLLLAGLLILAFPQTNAAGIAQTRLAVGVLIMLLFLGVALHAIPVLQLRDLLSPGWRPALATILMAILLRHWAAPDTFPLSLRLLAEVGAGGTAYVASLLLLWWLAGKPEGPERYLIDKLRPHTQTSKEIEVAAYRSIDDLPRAATDLMAAQSQNDIEASPGWFRNLQSTVFPDDPGVRYWLVRRDGDYLAILPIRYAKQRIEALANFYTSLYQPAFAKKIGFDDLAVLLHRAAREQGGTHEMRFAPMDRDSPAYRHLLAALRRIDWVPFPYFCFGNWTLRVDSDWPTYLAKRPGAVRSTLRRMAKKFAAAGGTLEIVGTPEHLENAIAAYVEVYAASWKVPEPYPDFMPGLIRLLAAQGALRLGIAKLAGRPIAVQLWIVQGERAAIYKLAHREDCVEHAAGTLLTAHLMEHVIAIDKVREVDYLIGDDDYKKNWMNQRRERWGIVAYNPKTAFGMTLLLREALVRLLKHFLPSGKA